jgi:hypothetical protein
MNNYYDILNETKTKINNIKSLLKRENNKKNQLDFIRQINKNLTIKNKNLGINFNNNIKKTNKNYLILNNKNKKILFKIKFIK